MLRVPTVVRAEGVFGERLLELKREALAHDADGVDRVHQRIHPRPENVSFAFQSFTD